MAIVAVEVPMRNAESPLASPLPRADYRAGAGSSTREMVRWTWEHYPQSRTDHLSLMFRVVVRSLELQGIHVDRMSAADFIAVVESSNCPNPMSIYVMAHSMKKAIEDRAAIQALLAGTSPARVTAEFTSVNGGVVPQSALAPVSPLAVTVVPCPACHRA